MGFMESINEITKKMSYRKTIEIEGIKVTLAILSVSEEQRVNAEDEEDESLEGMPYINEIRKKVLAHSIKAIDGNDLPDIIEYEKDGKIVKQTRELFLSDFLSKLPTAGLDIIFEAYADLKDEINDSMDGKIRVNWYLTPEERERKREEEIKKANKDISNKSEEEEESKPINFRRLPDDVKEEPESSNNNEEEVENK